MDYLSRSVLAIFLLGLGSSCKKGNDGMDAGGPIARYVHGNWKLEKVITPSQTKIGAQIGYTETIESGNDQVEDYDRIFHDGKLIATYVWSRSAPITNESEMTVIISYADGMRRFYKIKQEPGKSSLEASAYLLEIGTAQDSIKYYYSSIN